MYFINAGELEIENSKPLERKGQSNDFQAAKRKADKLLKLFAQVEVVDAKTNKRETPDNFHRPEEHKMGY